MSFKRFAVIADIHGNSDALAAVLADIDALNIQTIINLGDHLSGPLAARETADMLMAREMIAIRGNHDRWLVEKAVEDIGPSDRVAYDQLEERHLAWLRDMPATKVLADGRITDPLRSYAYAARCAVERWPPDRQSRQRWLSQL